MSKYEQLIEFIINEQEDQARELFHQIVVEKSREIYESIIDEQDLEEIGGDPVESLVDEVTTDQVGMAEDDTELDMPGEPDMSMDIAGDNMSIDDDAASAVADAKDDIDEIFNRLMSQISGDEEMDMDMDMDADSDLDSEEGDEEGDEEEYDDEEDYGDDEELQEAKATKKEEMLKAKDEKDAKGKRKMTEAEWLREYVDQIGEVYGQEPAQEEGHEVGHGKKAKVDTHSPVGPGVNMGGNVVKSKGSQENPDGKQTPEPNNEYSKGKGNLPHAGKFQNVPGGNAGKTTFKSKESAKTGEEGGVNDKSPLAKA